LSLDTRGLEKDLSTPSFSSRLSISAARNSSRSLRLGVAVVGVQDQWLAAAFADPLPQAGSAHQIRCNAESSPSATSQATILLL
jgi:hypothetical protein